jgi:hypothetical protein
VYCREGSRRIKRATTHSHVRGEEFLPISLR